MFFYSPNAMPKESALTGDSQVPPNTDPNYRCISMLKSSVNLPQGRAGVCVLALCVFVESYN